MMNILALSLILITLGASGIFSPNADTKAVVVEFEKDNNNGGGNTKVSISPQEAAQNSRLEKGYVLNAMEKISEKAEEVKQRFKDAAAVLPNVGEGISGHQEEEEEVKETAKEAAEKVKTAAKEKVTEKVKDRRKKELKDILRRGGEVLYDAFEYIFSPENLTAVFGTAHLLGLATAYGMCVWVSFISSYVLSTALPRQQIATVQTKLYPLYFKAMGYSIGAAFSGHFLGQTRWPYSSATEAYLGFNLVAALIMVLVNLVYLEPRAAKVMVERMKMEKEEGRGMNGEGSGGGSPGMMKLSKRLKKLNSQSSFLNVLTLMAMTLHLAHIAQRVHTVC
ncbi:PREDICTED: transmembrane protein 205-like [Ipomoea nil]|uniref:transmembrane protein 205-like n=1 Tax=Ipomoea nil TaxID=35883 RepID=UPI0009009AA1|nr:PREDICTED: transmembrane protein 205-like [Ipomoea nil]